MGGRATSTTTSPVYDINNPWRVAGRWDRKPSPTARGLGPRYPGRGRCTGCDILRQIRRELLVYGDNGEIRSRHPYGHGPDPPKG